jgi:8-oxo-dGTP pyrophosphatase MutT (NUDIX family)
MGRNGTKLLHLRLREWVADQVSACRPGDEKMRSNAMLTQCPDFMAKKTRDRIQFAALPFRIGENGGLQVMLLTSRETHRWIIPKGWPMRRKMPREVAAQEAYEEAGLIGRIVGKRPIGVFHYEKRLPAERSICEVQVFLLRVERQLEEWPEKGQRETGWFDLNTAANLVEEGWLAEIMRDAFAPTLRRRPHRKRHSRKLSFRMQTALGKLRCDPD